MDTHAAAARLRAFYETLTPSALDRLAEVYAPDAAFRDPFNDVRGVDAIARLFRKMYAQIDDVRFTFADVLVDGDAAMLGWTMAYRMKRLAPQTLRRIEGVTHLRFRADGRATFHRDYWDAAHDLYEHFPFVGGVLRWLRRRVA